MSTTLTPTALAVTELTEALIGEDFLETLSHLRETELSVQEARDVLLKRISGGIRTFVVLLLPEETIVGTASLLIEQKFIHKGGKVGHIEDVTTREGYEGLGVGRAVTMHAVEQARAAGCYKVILDCSEENVPFYIKCGFNPHEIEMRLDLQSPLPS